MIVLSHAALKLWMGLRETSVDWIVGGGRGEQLDELVAAGVVDLVDDGYGPMVLRRHGVRVGTERPAEPPPDDVGPPPHLDCNATGRRHHAAVLAILAERGATTGAIAAKLGRKPRYTGEILSKMAKDGMIEAGLPTHDGRFWRRPSLG